MSICYFGKDRENKIKCTYAEENGITVHAEYDISDEIESQNGKKTWNSSTRFSNRDIIVADLDNSNYILIKNAYYAGSNSRDGSIDDHTTAIFKSDSYIKSSSLSSIFSIADKTSFTKIRVYSDEIFRQYGSPSITLKHTDEKTIIEMNKISNPIESSININNVHKIYIGDSWKIPREKDSQINICICDYIELTFSKDAPIDECYKYLKELAIYLQLFNPGKYKFDKIQLCIENYYVNYFLEFDEFDTRKGYSENSVAVKLIDFLSNCYTNIPYRDGREEIRNIPYIINHKYRSLEDNFLSCFRFIECYYKRTTNLRENIRIINRAMKEHPQNISCFKTLGATNYKEEIIHLRNQYVHSGFYLKNCSLEIKHNGVVKRVVKDIDYLWLYERTQLLYKIAIDIIFKSMLGYTSYNYN